MDAILATLNKHSAATFILADTGAGKSTLSNYLAGRPLKIIQKPHEPTSYLIEVAGTDSLKIGHKAAAMTKIPAVVTTKEG